MSGIPREIDETAYIDGYAFPRFFVQIFLPLIKAGVGVAAFFCFMFSWVELLLARTLTSVNAKPIAATMTRTVSASGMDWATLAAAGVLRGPCSPMQPRSPPTRAATSIATAQASSMLLACGPWVRMLVAIRSPRLIPPWVGFSAIFPQ